MKSYMDRDASGKKSRIANLGLQLVVETVYHSDGKAQNVSEMSRRTTGEKVAVAPEVPLRVKQRRIMKKSRQS